MDVSNGSLIRYLVGDRVCPEDLGDGEGVVVVGNPMFAATGRKAMRCEMGAVNEVAELLENSSLNHIP